MGTTGLAVTGGAFFNDWSSTDGDVALYNEGGPRAKISILKKKYSQGLPSTPALATQVALVCNAPHLMTFVFAQCSVGKHGLKRCLPLALLCLIIRLVPPSYDFFFIQGVFFTGPP